MPLHLDQASKQVAGELLSFFKGGSHYSPNLLQLEKAGCKLE